jgi:hypothetical protein
VTANDDGSLFHCRVHGCEFPGDDRAPWRGGYGARRLRHEPKLCRLRPSCFDLNQRRVTLCVTEPREDPNAGERICAVRPMSEFPSLAPMAAARSSAVASSGCSRFRHCRRAPLPRAPAVS